MEINEEVDGFDEVEESAFGGQEDPAPEAAEPAPDAEAEDAWESPTFSSPEEFEAFRQGIAAETLEDRFFSEQPQPGQQAPEVYAPPDAYAPPTGPAQEHLPPEVQALMQEDPELGRALVSMASTMANQAVEQQMSRVTPLLDLLAGETGTRFAKEQIDGFKREIGDFNEDAAMAIAAGLVDSDGEQAFGKAALMTRQIEYGAEQRGYERGKREALDSLRATSTAPTEPGTSVAASESQPGSASLNSNPSVDEIESMWDAVETNALVSTRPGYPVS